MNLKRRALILGFWSSIAVAVFIIGFVVALIFTFSPNFAEWNGIEAYAKDFKSLQMLTVFPSIFLASAYVVFTVSIHYYAEDEKKIWSHLSIVFGLMYAIISTINYLIQIITVMPNIQNQQLSGLDAFVAGYPNSIFYALMASYFFMCISAIFIALVFNSDKGQKEIRILFIGSGLAIPLCLLSIFVSASFVLPLAGFIWFVCMTAGFIKIAIYFWKILTFKDAMHG